MAPNIVKYNPPSSAYASFNGGGKSSVHATRSIMPHDSYQHPERFWVDYVVEASSKEHARVSSLQRTRFDA